MTAQDIWDTVLKGWIGYLALVPVTLLAVVVRARRGKLWPVLGFRAVWPAGRALALLRASNASALALYNQNVRAEPNGHEAWAGIFNEADWVALRDFKDPVGTFDIQVESEPLASSILQKLTDLPRPSELQLWITGEAEMANTTVLLQVFFGMLGVGAGSDRAPVGQRPVPMLLRYGHLDEDQIVALKSAGTLQPILGAWLANRGIDLHDEQPTLDSLTREFEKALKAGAIAIFLDGYDRFIRLRLQSPVETMLKFPVYVATAMAPPRGRAGDGWAVAHMPPRSERYRASFGQLFAEHQDWLLAGNYSALEDAYVNRIERAIAERAGKAEDVCLVDLMAGGASARWYRLMAEHQSLRVLGLDRDAAHIDELGNDSNLQGRYSAWVVALHGSSPDGGEAGNLNNREEGLDIRGRLQEVFGRSKEVGADIIVGKKALHEIGRDLQPKLIDHCARALRDGGRLILFADSMGELTDDDRRLLAEVRRQLHQSRSAKSPPEEFEHLVLDMPLGESARFVGLFCNLLVMLKDRANVANMLEVENRYFAGPDEITKWCSGAGLVPVPERPTDGHYRFSPVKFNETALREELDREIRADPHQIQDIVNSIVDSSDAWFDLFNNFCHGHLFPRGVRSRLGDYLDAKQGPDAWTPGTCNCKNLATHDVLGGVNRAANLTFDFPVHILEFLKQTARSPAAHEDGASSALG